MEIESQSISLFWTAEHSVGVERFDRQHKKLFELIRELYTALQARNSRTVVGEILGELYAYSVSHMTDEEDVLEYFGFPNLDRHRTEHRQFRKRIRDYMADFDNGNTAIALSIFVFLQDWITSHVIKSDRQYTEFLNRRGLR